MDTSDVGLRWSYAAVPAGIRGRLHELRALLEMVRRGPAEQVGSTVEAVAVARRQVQEVAGMRLEGKRMLEIGPGQHLKCMKSFSLDNTVVGIDMDVVPHRLTPAAILRMIRCNPSLRVAKTLVRKALGFDARFDRLLGTALGVPRFPELDVFRMDAAHLEFPDRSFDFVYSFSVFEHISDPAEAMREIVRVLVPGGVSYQLIHLYTSNSGHHDPRISLGEPPPPYWPHLRPGLERTIHPGVYVNGLRLGRWSALLDEIMPAAHLIKYRQDHLASHLCELRAAGELRDYDDEELLTVVLIAIWRKPADCLPPGTTLPP